MNNNVAVVDLFCGVGGLTCGLKKAGLDVVAGIDNDATCRYAYEENNHTKFIEADVSKLPSSDVDNMFGKAEIKVLVGCAPYQRFSRHANKYRKSIDTKTDVRWNLLRSFAQYIEDIKPDIVSMENVPELHKYDIFEDFLDKLDELGYHTSYKIVDCSKYGLPQKRRRLVLLASKHGDIQLIPGGTWRDWDESLLPECYKKPSGKSFGSVYGRMEWDKPSPTVTTQFYLFGTGRYGHPEQDRAISLREGALLQTFPRDYKFFEDVNNVSIGTISRHIGNAVPVDLGKIIGVSINEHLENIKL